MNKKVLVVLACCGALFSLLGGGSARAVVPGANGLIAFVRSDFNTGIDTTYVVNPDGTHQKLVLAGAYNPYWSPDGRFLAMQTPYNGGCPPCSSTTILNPDTGRTRVLSPPDSNLATGCSLWSPDALHFACSGENDNNPSLNGIYTIRTKDGGGLTRITNAGGGGLVDIPIDYSPDGTRLVFGRVSFEDHSCTTRSALYVVNVDGSGLHRITPWGFCDDDGSWSPDGSEIAFASGNQFGRIYVVHPDGTGLMQIPIPANGGSGLGDVSWSPDGSKITFIGASSGEGIYTANANGTDLQQVTNSGFAFDHEGAWGSHPLNTTG
jgi:Tol biopolymer transport system component